MLEFMLQCFNSTKDAHVLHQIFKYMHEQLNKWIIMVDCHFSYIEAYGGNWAHKAELEPVEMWLRPSLILPRFCCTLGKVNLNATYCPLWTMLSGDVHQFSCVIFPQEHLKTIFGLCLSLGLPILCPLVFQS